MRTVKAFALVVAAGLLAGCSSVTGTWVSKGGPDQNANPIARVTFAGDGTFTAEADYGPKGKQAMSGTWECKMGKLCLESDGQKREYDVSVKHGELTICKSGAPADAKKYTMTKMKGKSMWGL
ncbi:MAG: hypothetical protein L6Q92_11955 [Phycisphaerae bacterium]|nr:hypothetical protein [Phycisphaerae bacterium]